MSGLSVDAKGKTKNVWSDWMPAFRKIDNSLWVVAFFAMQERAAVCSLSYRVLVSWIPFFRFSTSLFSFPLFLIVVVFYWGGMVTFSDCGSRVTDVLLAIDGLRVDAASGNIEVGVSFTWVSATTGGFCFHFERLCFPVVCLHPCGWNTCLFSTSWNACMLV